MADLSFYESKYGIKSADLALQKFAETIQSYYDIDYYVDWGKVYTNSRQFHRELLLISSLCDEPDKERAARELLRDFPQVIEVLPILMACRLDGRCRRLYVLENLDQLTVRAYEFPHRTPNSQPTDAEIELYIHFLLTSGLLTLLQQIKHIPDYITGVEVGMDTNARKNRSGQCAVKALRPSVLTALEKLPDVDCKSEATFKFLVSQGCVLPKTYKRKIWDWAFWTRSTPRRFVVVEVNHYGVPGSKPESIAGEYLARQQVLRMSGVGFVWATDGYGWLKMLPALSEVFEGIEHLINIRLARDGQLEWALRRLMFGDPVNQLLSNEPVYTSRQESKT